MILVGPLTDRSGVCSAVSLSMRCSLHRLDAVAYLRERELRFTVHQIYAKSNTLVDIRATMSFTMMNVITSTIWGGILDSVQERESVCEKLTKLVDEMIDLFRIPNLSDFFPVLARFDLQGVQREMKVLIERFDKIIEGVIEKRHAHIYTILVLAF